MKRIPVDECPAGIEIDVAVARVRHSEINLVVDFEHGLIATSQERLAEALREGWIGWDISEDKPIRFCIKLSKYSTDIITAWELVELEKIAVIPLKSDRWLAIPYSTIPDDYTAYKIDLMDGEIASTAPLAITRAFLKAKGIKFVEVPDETNTG